MRISKLRSEITFNLDGYWQFLNDKSNRFPTCNNFVSVFGSRAETCAESPIELSFSDHVC